MISEHGHRQGLEPDLAAGCNGLEAGLDWPAAATRPTPASSAPAPRCAAPWRTPGATSNSPTTPPTLFSRSTTTTTSRYQSVC